VKLAARPAECEKLVLVRAARVPQENLVSRHELHAETLPLRLLNERACDVLFARDASSPSASSSALAYAPVTLG
jgi:hypothetical protein